MLSFRTCLPCRLKSEVGSLFTKGCRFWKSGDFPHSFITSLDTNAVRKLDVNNSCLEKKNKVFKYSVESRARLKYGKDVILRKLSFSKRT